MLVGLLLTPLDGGSSAATAATGALTDLLPNAPPLPKAQKQAIAAITKALRDAPAFSDADWEQAQALLRNTCLRREDLVTHAATSDALHAQIMTRLKIQGDSGGERLFDLALGAMVRDLCGDRNVLQDIQPDLIRDIKQEQTHQSDQLAQILDKIDSATAQDLADIATAFEIDLPDRPDLPQLRALLHAKAEDYRQYRAQIEAMDDRSTGLANLKAAAKDAIARLHFTEVENRLARVDEVETENNARTKELRAKNALMVGKADFAYQRLTTAADSFVSVGREEVSTRRNDYAKVLYDHGLRYGGHGLERAVQMWRDNLNRLDQTRDSEPWATTQHNLGGALRNQGSRSAGPEGARLLGEAVTAYRNALRVTTEDTQPLDGAMTQENLALAEQARARHDSCADPAPHLRAALDHVTAALRVYDPTHHSYDHDKATRLRDKLRATLAAGGEA